MKLVQNNPMVTVVRGVKMLGTSCTPDKACKTQSSLTFLSNTLFMSLYNAMYVRNGNELDASG